MNSRSARRERASNLALGLVALAALCMCGCAGYQLGPVNGVAAREKSVQVRPFVNQTLAPRLTDAVTSELRRELQRDGTYLLTSRDDGDIVLSGSLTRYERQEVTFTAQDILRVQDYRLSLTAQVIARERSTGKTLLDQAVTGYTLLRAGSDPASAERQALPLLATDLARNVTRLLAEGSW